LLLEMPTFELICTKLYDSFAFCMLVLNMVRFWFKKITLNEKTLNAFG
jgi:hypothetical protein